MVKEIEQRPPLVGVTGQGTRELSRMLETFYSLTRGCQLDPSVKSQLTIKLCAFHCI